MMQAQVEAPECGFRRGGRTHGKQRGAVVRGRSRGSYRRLLWAIAATAHMFRYAAWFVTLTHGKDAPGWMDSKEMFNRWKYKACRKLPAIRGIWVAEAQKRGAPHYHLLLSGPGPAGMGWMQLAWYRETGDEGSDPEARKRHAFDARIYGESQTDAAVELYLAKIASYELSKKSQQDTEEHTGRTWGYCNRKGMVEAMMRPEFAALDAADVRNWFEDRARNALEIADKNAGADVVTDDGEFIKLCYASTVEFSTNAREFINEHRPSDPR